MLTLTTTVAYVVESYPVLSQTFVRNEVEELRRQGMGVVVVSLWSGEPSYDGASPNLILCETRLNKQRAVIDHIAAFIRSPRRYVHFLVTVRALGEEARTTGWRRAPSLARNLRRMGVDRLHAHFAWGGAAAAAVLSALTGWPWALTVHARDIFADRRHLELKLRRTDRLITVCDYNRRFLVERLDYRGPISIVVCGVTAPTASPPIEPNLGLIFVGRMVEKKGVDVLLRAIAELLPRLPEIQLDLIGDGPLLEPMRALASSLGLAEVARFRGATAHAEVLDLIAGATVLCLPARVAPDGDVDSMPVVVKEAMIRKVAVAGCDVGAISEMLADGCGELVPPEDPAALAEALHRLSVDPAYRATCTARAYERATERFLLPDQVRRLSRILEDLTG